jgi:copper chaperone CopZ
MRTYFLLLAITFAFITNAQVTKVSLQASGLTCSMCSNAINKALYTLDFVENVDADIKNYTFEISFKPNSNIDFDKIRRKVENAGFSISGFVATINFDNVVVNNSAPVRVGDQTFLFTEIKDHVLNGARKITILNKGFVSSRQYKRNPVPAPAAGAYHATI